MLGFEDAFIRKFENKNYLSGKANHIRVPSNKVKGFNFEYVLIIPEKINNKSRIILEGMNYSTDKKFTEEEGIEYIYETSKSFRHPIHYCNSEANNCILIPLIPRYYDENLEMEVYTNQLASTCFLDNIKDKYLRIDNQIVNMIQDAKEKLKKNNIIIKDKIIIEGFSASGKFANRFTLIHPEIVDLCIAGGLTGTLILPLKELKGEELIYPVGIANIKEIDENKIEQFKKISQFYYFNTRDRIDSFAKVNKEPLFKGIILKNELDLLYKVLGTKPKDRWKKSKEVYKNFKNITFKEYDEEHKYNFQIMEYIKELIDNEI